MAVKTHGSVSFGEGNKIGSKAWNIEVRPHVAIKLKRVFAKVGGHKRDLYRLSDTVDNARDLEWFMERWPLEIDPASAKHLAARARQHREQTSMVEQLLAGTGVKRHAFELALPPRQYQREAAELYLATGGLLVADDMGLGKTIVGIATLTDPSKRPAFVCVPASLPEQWRRQVAKFAPELRTHVLRTKSLYSLESCKRHRLVEDPTARGGARCARCDMTRDDVYHGRGGVPDVIIGSYAKMVGWADTLAELVKSVVFDEAQELRHGEVHGESTKKYAAAQVLARACGGALALTGTPVYNYGSEVFAVLDICRPDALGTRGEFLTEWGGLQHAGGQVELADPRAFGLYAREAGLMLRRTRDDVGIELPPLSNIVEHIDADLEALDQVGDKCAELAKFLLGLGNSPLKLSPEAKQKGEKMLASEELSNALRQATGIAKAPFVAEFVRMLLETGEKVVLFGWHRACFGRGTPVLMHDGRIKPVEDVEVGDRVMGPDSQPRNVLRLTPGHGRLYRVVPTKGAAWVCSEHHILTLHRSERGCEPNVKMTAAEFDGLSERTKRGYQLYRRGVATFDGEQPVLEPWLLGYWLGDGAADLRGTLRVASADPEVRQECEVIASRHGLVVKEYELKAGTTPCRFFDLVLPADARYPARKTRPRKAVSRRGAQGAPTPSCAQCGRVCEDRARALARQSRNVPAFCAEHAQAGEQAFWRESYAKRRAPLHNRLKDHFRSLGLHKNKHVPASYLTSSR
ncbi:MAG TPA: SNF2-related protein, partial [Solirubrobacteraceae bacterium]|nr:SNF2-related protein [Solirubrobacteraceae bacterium]